MKRYVIDRENQLSKFRLRRIDPVTLKRSLRLTIQEQRTALQKAALEGLRD